MSFRITFRGLIAHVQVNTGQETRAVLVDASGHQPVLTVDTTNDWNAEANSTPPSSMVGTDKVYDLTGWNVSITSGQANVRTIRKSSFTAHVPSLPAVLIDSNAANKTVLAAIHNKAPHSAVFSYVDYTDGTIESLDCFDQAVKWIVHPNGPAAPAGGDPQCISRVTQYLSEWDQAVVLHVSRGTASGSITLNPNAHIFISNRAGMGNHFHEYRRITPAQGIRIPVPDGKRLCIDCMAVSDMRSEEHGHASLLSAGTVECTQTGYP